MTAPWTLSVATYNILADAYIRPQHYPLVDPADFAPERRHPKLDARIAALGTDVICLQEVEHPAFVRLEALLRPAGYRGRWAHRPNGKPDGLATFVRAPWAVPASFTLEFAEGPGKPTNRIALLSTLQLGDSRNLVSVANVHLEWHDDDAGPEARHGLRQAAELAGFLSGETVAVVCGDMNAVPGSDVLTVFGLHGFSDPHPKDAATFNAGGPARKIDHMLHASGLRALPTPPARVTDETPLPSSDEPSDHVPLAATFMPIA